MSPKFKGAILPVMMVVGFVAAADFMALQASAQDAPVTSSTADNTRVNQRDRSADTIKPTDQPNDKDDIKLLSAVRRAVVDDKSISVLAHNVKIVVMSGAVMLRGPVKSQEEKLQVGKIVAGVPGVSEITNELDVKQ
ncbi:BON domain-containing protein [Pseudolysobacter antarcticus]|nr:BON domain-containing protein [Pseudolysobacter antarcticus]